VLDSATTWDPRGNVDDIVGAEDKQEFICSKSMESEAMSFSMRNDDDDDMLGAGDGADGKLELDGGAAALQLDDSKDAEEECKSNQIGRNKECCARTMRMPALSIQFLTRIGLCRKL
jgi:hypothetical protein